MSGALTTHEVMTLQETADYLRLPEETVSELVDRRGLPGRRIDSEWRFLRSAVDDWLSSPEKRNKLVRQFGALKDDPFLDKMVEQIYQERTRPATDDS